MAKVICPLKEENALYISLLVTSQYLRRSISDLWCIIYVHCPQRFSCTGTGYSRRLRWNLGQPTFNFPHIRTTQPSKFIHKHWLHLTKNVPNKRHFRGTDFLLLLAADPLRDLPSSLSSLLQQRRKSRSQCALFRLILLIFGGAERSMPSVFFVGYFVKFIHVSSAVFLEYQCDQSRSEMLLWCCCCMFVVCP